MNPHSLYNKEDGPCYFTAVASGGQEAEGGDTAVRALGLAMLGLLCTGGLPGTWWAAIDTCCARQVP